MAYRTSTIDRAWPRRDTWSCIRILSPVDHVHVIRFRGWGGWGDYAIPIGGKIPLCSPSPCDFV